MSDPQDPQHVAEQTGVVLEAYVTDQPLEPLLLEAKTTVATDAMGAVVTFEGPTPATQRPAHSCARLWDSWWTNSRR